MIWAAAGAFLALGLTLWLIFPPSSPFLLASIGGSTVFLFGLTRAAAAQPRSLFGGHLIAAAVGIACGQAFGNAFWVYALACALTLVLMLTLRTVHPPAGATPLIMVQAQAGWDALWYPVGLSLLVLAVIAFIWTRILPGTVRYPAKWIEPSPPSTWWGNWKD